MRMRDDTAELRSDALDQRSIIDVIPAREAATKLGGCSNNTIRDVTSCCISRVRGRMHCVHGSISYACAASGAASRIEQVHQAEADADTSQQLRARCHIGELLFAMGQARRCKIATARPSRSSSLAHVAATYLTRLRMNQLCR